MKTLRTRGLRSAAEVESLIARTDIVVTTWLHGLVLAIKNGVPPVVVDPEVRDRFLSAFTGRDSAVEA